MKVLFICTGNVFRSMTAEKCLKDYAKKNGLNIEVDSCGTRVKSPNPPKKGILERLKFHGISHDHQHKQITKKLIDENDVVVAMSVDHKEYVKEKFDLDIPLFNEIAYGKKEKILDFHETEEGKEVMLHAHEIVDYIHDAIPHFVNNLEKFRRSSH